MSPAILTNPAANKPAAEVQALIRTLSLNATKAEDLAMASAAGAINKTQILTAASLKKLDDDLRTVHANAVLASQDALDSDGWMKWVRYKHDEEILQLKTRLNALIDIVMENATESQKAKVRAASLLSAKAAVFRRSADLCFMCSLPRLRRNASASWRNRDASTWRRADRRARARRMSATMSMSEESEVYWLG